MSGLVRREGFEYAFDPSVCDACNGACCRGAEGNVWVSEDELEAIAATLGEPLEQARALYTQRERDRLRLRERAVGSEYYCVFLRGGKCAIYEARPKQCRSFPFWESMKQCVEVLKIECAAVVTI